MHSTQSGSKNSQHKTVCSAGMNVFFTIFQVLTKTNMSTNHCLCYKPTEQTKQCFKYKNHQLLITNISITVPKRFVSAAPYHNVSLSEAVA